MKVLHLILEDGKGKHLRLSQKKIGALVDKISRAFNPRRSKKRVVIYFSYQDVVDGESSRSAGTVSGAPR